MTNTALRLYRELRARAEKAEALAEERREVLRRVLWAAGYLSNKCPSCRYPEILKHADGCNLAAALRDDAPAQQRPFYVASCANRRTAKYLADDGIETTVVERDTNEPDGYSREELVSMLQEVRKHEAIQAWRVPEPTQPQPDPRDPCSACKEERDKMRAQIAALTAERDTLRVVVDTLNEYAPCWESIVDDEDAVIIRSAIARAAGEEKGRG